MNDTTKILIRKADHDDLVFIDKWLTNQPSNIESLKGNWKLTQDMCRADDLWVYEDLQSNRPVAYFWGDLNTTESVIDIWCEYRAKGIGRRIVRFLEEKSRTKQNCLLMIECSPKSSAGFWERMGYKIVREDTCILAQKILRIEHGLPAAAEPVEIIVRFYPECIKWSTATKALREDKLTGSKRLDGSIQLSRQVGFFRPSQGDLAGEVVVAGKSIYKDKLKYESARSLGFVKCHAGFFIDVIEIHRSVGLE
ncbi:GNAT family N-acetyltransferase [Allopusillimonas ginsengisoli]|nr:GNAT family N-acetyltransferase [Allopusillimonas ginsengisoli]